MKKEVKSKQIVSKPILKKKPKPIIPNLAPKITPTPIPTPQKVRYQQTGGKSLGEMLGEKIPKQFTPTKRMGTIFGAIFLLVAIIALLQFPYGSFMSGNIDITINVGYPLPFLELKLAGEGGGAKIGNLLIDMLIYIVLAYAIDISINLITKNPLLQSEKQKKAHPTVFKDKPQTIAEKITKKVLEKDKPTPIKKPAQLKI